MQFVIAMIPVGESELCGHPWQTPDPSVLLYLPASHASHGPPSGPDQSVLQVQSVEAVLCEAELESAGQDKQVDEPVVSEYVPHSQTLQTAQRLRTLLCTYQRHMPCRHHRYVPNIRPCKSNLSPTHYHTVRSSSRGMQSTPDLTVSCMQPHGKIQAVQFEQSGSGITGSTTNVVVRFLPSKSGLT